MGEREDGKLEQKVDQCLQGITDIKGHIGEIYEKSAASDKEIAIIRADAKAMDKDIGSLQKVNWTIGCAVLLAIIGAVAKLILR